MKYRLFGAGMAAALSVFFLAGCENKEVLSGEPEQEREQPLVLLEDVARVLSGIPLERDQLDEVYDAARASAGNGYDEEYRMRELFEDPGCGVGSAGSTKAGGYAHPLRELLREAVRSTKAAAVEDPDAWLDALSASDIQLYWPFSEAWDGDSQPVITFDPGGDVGQNEGYLLEGDGKLTKLLVTEEMARERPVWVVNRNSDADYKTLEMLRREDPAWGQGGGNLLITKATQPAKDTRTLVLRSFKARRPHDSWLCGASEYFVKFVSVENVKISKEEELRLYDPSITDFMVIVRRGEVGQEISLNTILVSEWGKQLTSCSMMIIEDDGGTKTSWKCSAMVKYNSKSYGFEVDLPYNQRDDIIWRGPLTKTYLEKNSGLSMNYGEVDLVMELLE